MNTALSTQRVALAGTRLSPTARRPAAARTMVLTTALFAKAKPAAATKAKTTKGAAPAKVRTARQLFHQLAPLPHLPFTPGRLCECLGVRSAGIVEVVVLSCWTAW
jgi:hypothetical protein